MDRYNGIGQLHTEGHWVKHSEAEALEKQVKELKAENKEMQEFLLDFMMPHPDYPDVIRFSQEVYNRKIWPIIWKK